MLDDKSKEMKFLWKVKYIWRKEIDENIVIN